MKTFITLCILALAIPLSGQTEQTAEQTDPYSINLIRMALKLQGQGIYLSVVHGGATRRRLPFSKSLPTQSYPIQQRLRLSYQLFASRFRCPKRFLPMLIRSQT
jgi:hypothetical protein